MVGRSQLHPWFLLFLSVYTASALGRSREINRSPAETLLVRSHNPVICSVSPDARRARSRVFPSAHLASALNLRNGGLSCRLGIPACSVVSIGLPDSGWSPRRPSPVASLLPLQILGLENCRLLIDASRRFSGPGRQNILLLSSGRLEVAKACSGIQSLFSLFHVAWQSFTVIWLKQRSECVSCWPWRPFRFQF